MRFKRIFAGIGAFALCATVVLLLSSLSAVLSTAQADSPPVPLRKLPPADISQGAQWARIEIRERFPEIFAGPITGQVVVTLVFAPDGKVIHASKQMFAEGVPPTGLDVSAAAVAAGAEAEDVAYGGDEDLYSIGPWLDTVNADRISVVYAVLRWPLDPSRTSARVRRSVRTQFPELFASKYPPRYATVFMNDDGGIARSRTEMLTPLSHGTPLALSADPYEGLGIEPSSVGRSGITHDGGVTIAYAWPRRRDDGPNVRNFGIPLRPSRDDTSDDRAIIERYFPKTTQGHPLRSKQRWILMGRDGHIWGTGEGAYNDFPPNLLRDVEARYPGIKVMGPAGLWGSTAARGMSCLGDTHEEWEALNVACVWIAPNSPVQRLDRVDFSKRADVLLIASGAAGPANGVVRQVAVALKFGMLTTLPEPYKMLQILATDGGLDHADIMIKPVSDRGDGVDARIAYGERETIQVDPAGDARGLALLISRIPAPDGTL
jgi:hypothetical protein